MEDVIVGLLFVYFFVIRPILKQARKASQKGEGGKPEKAPKRRKQVSLSELFAKAQEKLREVAEQAEAAKRAQAERGDSPTGTSWQDLFAGPAREQEGETWGEPARTPLPMEWETGEILQPRGPATPTGSPDVAESHEPGTTPEPHRRPGSDGDAIPGLPETVGPRQTESGWRSPRNIAHLRQAVVWSEILGPPVSLRDDG